MRIFEPINDAAGIVGFVQHINANWHAWYTPANTTIEHLGSYPTRDAAEQEIRRVHNV